MPGLWGKKKKEKEKQALKKQPSPTHHHIAVLGQDKKQHTSPSSHPPGHDGDSNSSSPSASSQDLVGKLVTTIKPPASGMTRRDSGVKVAAHKKYYEDLSMRSSSVSSPGSYSPRRVESPEKKRRDIHGESSSSLGSTSPKVSVTVTSPGSGSGNRTPLNSTPSFKRYSRPISDYSPSSPANKRMSMLSDNPGMNTTEVGKEKEFPGVTLPLPPLQTTAVHLREVDARRNAQGGFGFILRKSFLPMHEDPDTTKLIHLIEPRSDYRGPLMTGDRIIEVNGEMVEDAPHEIVVGMIKASGDCVNLKVASMPELLELNNRGALDHTFERNSGFRKSGKALQGTGTLRRQGKLQNKFKAKTEAEVLLEREGLSQERVWVVHKGGFCLGTIVKESPKRASALSTHVSFFKSQGKERVRLDQTGEIIEIEDDDMEKANPMSLDKVEDLVNLVHLNESSVLHVLRQRYGSSLIHTFAGRHLIILNPMKPLSSYSDRVIDMFRGCRREDMPPHIFAMGQQAYRDMMVTRQDQSLILMGLSGSGKTFNTRYLLRYLTTIGQPEHGPVTNAKLDAVELLLHSFSSAATILNPQATRCACLYSLKFDPSGTLVGTTIQTYLLERNRICQRPLEEGNFNIFNQLFLGAEDELKSDLMLDAPIETEDANLYCEELDDPQREESARYVWDLIQNCLDILDISEDEAMGLWSLLAAIYHLGYAGVRKGSVRGADYFLNPAAARRAAVLLGVDPETLGQDIFSPPRGGTMRASNIFTSSFSSTSPTQSDTTSITSSLFLTNMGSSRSSFLDSFVMGLYDQAFNALVMLINRSLQPQLGSKSRSVIHVLDTSGFQHRELAGARNGASFDDLCMNYVQERLQMLFHDVSFTSEQDRYIQEEINWMFSEMAISPLAVIDTIDRHVPQRRGGSVDLHTDRRGLLWILDEESVFPGASDSSFLDRLHIYHGSGSGERSDAPLVKVVKEDNQFLLFHCQRTLPVLYDANEWVRKAREHPSFRVVVNILAASKSVSIGSIFQGRGVAASATTLSTSQLKADSHRGSLTRSGSTPQGMSFPSPSSGIKKSSLCLQTKFKIDFLVDMLRKTRQWFIRCLLPQRPHKLPGALESPDPTLAAEQEQAPTHYVDIDVPLVRDQLKRAEMIKATRIYKQGFPEHITFSEFHRRYNSLLPPDCIDGSAAEKKEGVEMVLFAQGVDKNTFRVGLSQAFFRAGTLVSLDRAVEERLHGTMVLFQARCRGWVGRQRFKQMQVQDSAALVIQQNVLSYLEVRDWSWWKLYLKVKPMLAIWRAEEDIKDRDSKIEKLKAKVEALESERDSLKESEAELEEKVTQLSAQLEDIQSSAHEASEMMEGEQLEKREMEEKLAETMAREAELTHVNEQLHLQIAEMSILARIKQTEEGEESSDSIMEKYYETRRELETLRQRVNSEFEDQIESLESAKRSLEKKLIDSESERDDLFKTLAQVRKKATKLGSEMNDLKLLLEAQQARNAELEKRQRKFDMDLSAAKDDSNSEVQAKVRLAREKEALQTELNELKERVKALEDENKQLSHEKEDLESELLSTTSSTSESELISLKRINRDMEAKIVDLEDELDEASLKLDNLQQTKARLELSNQTLKQQHGKELEGREEELEQVKVTFNKKLKSLTQQLDEVHEEKQNAVKARRDLERELLEHQSKMGDPENEKKLKKQIRKYKALFEDTQEQLENEREKRSNAAVVKSLKNQLEELQTSEASAIKNYKWLQGDMDELQSRYDDLMRAKIELESRVSELSRSKADLESRVEEDQFEIEELLEKQRTHISQSATVQSQLTEANFQVDELMETKAALESKVESLESKIAELEEGMNRHQFEASEHKVKELEQKLELERSSARRHESQITRLRHQLERMQDEKTEDVSHKNNDALNRSQKQIRELRAELQEAERKEQEAAKKRRNAESKVDELEAQLQVTQADLKSARKRIEQLHGALKDHEENSGDEDFQGSRDNSYDALSTEGSMYSMGDDDESLGFSDDEDDDDIIPHKGTSRGVDRTTVRSKELSPALSSGRRGSSKEDDEFDAARKARQRRLKELEEEEAQFEAARKARLERLKNLEMEEEEPKQAKIPKTRNSEVEREEEEKTGSIRRDKKLDSYDDDEDDDDLEEFLLKQRERMKKLEDSDYEEDDIKGTRGLTSQVSNEAIKDRVSAHVANGKANDESSSSRKSGSREQSEEPSHRRESVGEGEGPVPNRYRTDKRKQRRRRTLEQLTPEHLKANGVDL